ncbi:acylphosphatase [Salinisphaera sp. PC39]|uniref:acylphosphatase n=1 Tax=Salinisphaera sp. PC39 TaxID=1304156 RepID=UPI0033418F4F
MSECRHFLVSGRVQGVFFRASARARAVELGLTGWVANRPDGRVEGLACGPPAALDDFQAWLWEGPEAARVTGVECGPAPDATAPPEFTIR